MARKKRRSRKKKHRVCTSPYTGKRVSCRKQRIARKAAKSRKSGISKFLFWT